MVVEYRRDDFITWFTGSPNPCVSLYKPLIFTQAMEGNPFSSLEYGYKYSKKWRQNSKALLTSYKVFQRDIKSLRDQAEEEMIREMNQIFSNEESDRKKLQDSSLEIAENYLKSLRKRETRV